MNSEKFCLRWNDFESNISSAFRELRELRDDDQIQAHKVILSACSPFFRNVLRRNPHQHPLLYLKNVKYTDLQAVLNFMYHGEVSVAQEELNSFLSVAEDLKVKGLTQNQSGSENTKQSSRYQTSKDTPVTKPLQRTPDREPPPPKRPRPAPPVHQQPHDDDIQEVVPIKSEPHFTTLDQSNTTHTTPHHLTAQVYNPPQPVALADQKDSSLTTYQEQEEGYEEYGQYEERYEHQQGDMNMIGGDVGKGDDYPSPKSPSDLLSFCAKSPGSSKWVCGICGQFSHSGRHQVRNHVESKHFPTTFQYQCQYCDKITNTKKGLERHLSEKHRNYNYNANCS